GLKDFYSFSEGLAKGLGKDTKKPIVQSLKKFHTFNRLNKINNFLKHNTITACQTLKKFYPQNVVDGGLKYKNGMYAGNWIKIDENYLDEIFDKLLNFFGEFCKNILGENIEETNWNYDDYFKNAFHKKFKYPYENEDWGFGEDF
ncbi:MAG: hypothetical protein FWC11_06125, partial [Firmicutes bacterium]|nr:hypothetical protein [Bacillota bacterium]